MLSHSRHMGASIPFHRPSWPQIWESCWVNMMSFYVMFEAGIHMDTTSNIHMRHIQKVFEPFVWCLKGILWVHPYTHVKVHWPSWPQIWEFRVPCGVRMMSAYHHGWRGWWYHLPQTASNIHIRYAQSVWAIGVLSQQGQGHLHLGAPVYF